MQILHGENHLASRQKLSLLTQGQGEVIRLNGEKATLTEILQATESTSLLENQKIVVIENLFSRRPSKEKETIITYLKNNQNEKIVIWERKKIDGRTLASFKNVKTEKFELPSSLFRFLDSLGPDNAKTAYFYLHETLKSEAPELIFSMMVRQIRLLIIAGDLGENGLPGMAPWQKMKLVSQSRKFTLQGLISLFDRLLLIETKQKTGQAPLSLEKQLDLLVATL